MLNPSKLFLHKYINIKSFIFLQTTFLLATVSYAQKRVSNDPNQVTVFLNNAQLSHTITSQIEPGTSTIILEKLPLNINPQSIQATGTGAAVIQSVKFEMNYLTSGNKSKEVSSLEDSVKKLQKLLNQGNNDSDILKKEELLILNNQKLWSDQKGVSLEELKGMTRFHREKLTEIRNLLMANQEKAEAYSERIKQMQNQLNEALSRSNQPSGDIVIAVSAKEKTGITLTVSYVVTDAGWRPMYEVRANDGENKISLKSKAMVFQHTGMDWNNISLTLSTSNPTIGGNRPIMNPMHIDFYTPRPMNAGKTSRQQKKSDSYMAEMADGEEVMVNVPPTMQPSSDFTSIEETNLNLEYKIGLKYSIKGNGKEESIDIQQNEVPVTFKHFTTPRLDKDAFLVALASDWQNLNLLTGPVNVFYGNSFIGESWLNTKLPNDTLEFSLGRDQKIVVSREKIKGFSSSKVIGTNKREQIGYELTVRNNKSTPVQITIEDQIPVSSNSQIEVTLQESSNAVFDKERGFLTWNISLKPGETKKIILKYEVKYPKDKQIPSIN